MAFDSLQEKLSRVFKSIQGKAKFTQENIEQTLQEIRVVFLESDVNYTVTNNFLKAVKDKVIGKDVLTSLDPSQQIVKIIHDEIINLLKDEEGQNDLNLKNQGLTTIMLVGLQGTGKTTQAAKIANLLKNKKSKKVLLAACDVMRPAAIEQLQVLGNSIDVEVFTLGISHTALECAKQAQNYARDNNFDVCIIDTAGRLQIDEVLMNELKDIKSSLRPEEILLTVDALTGQDISNVSKAFHELLTITGLIVTKFDGDSKGGAVLSVRSITGVPIKFVGVGEKINDLDIFYPDRLADRILGMGDVISLVEKAQEEFDEKQAKIQAEKMLSGKFTMQDMLISIEQSQKLGPLGQIAKMLPGMSDYAKQFEETNADKQLQKTKAIIQSMTLKERDDPSNLRGSHKRRIAKGAGVSVDDVNKVINQYEKTKKMMKSLSSFSNMFKM